MKFNYQAVRKDLADVRWLQRGANATDKELLELLFEDWQEEANRVYSEHEAGNADVMTRIRKQKNDAMGQLLINAKAELEKVSLHLSGPPSQMEEKYHKVWQKKQGRA